MNSTDASRVLRVTLDESENVHGDLETITLTLADGRLVTLKLDSECCSSSHFERLSVEEAKTLVGQRLLAIEHVESALENRYCPDNDDPYTNTSGHIKYHALKITTDQGVMVLDWRNDSNGYYDGECEVKGWCDKANTKANTDCSGEVTKHCCELGADTIVMYLCAFHLDLHLETC